MMQVSKTSLRPPTTRRSWKRPRALTGWLWFAGSLLIYGAITVWFFWGLKTQQFPDPANDPFRLFGIGAFVMVILVASYSLRRRFVRVLPGRVQSWLWLHIWLGIASILVAFEHEDFQNILHNFQFTVSRFTESDAGMLALYALLLLVITGISGRLLDIWQARVIAAEARRNKVGIVQAVEERLHEHDLLIERLSAGKSAAFKEYCARATRSGRGPGQQLPTIEVQEQTDFQRVHEVLVSRANLARSLRRQRRAQQIILLWRYVHIPLACLALTVISFHSLLELAKLVLDLLGHRTIL